MNDKQNPSYYRNGADDEVRYRSGQRDAAQHAARQDRATQDGAAQHRASYDRGAQDRDAQARGAQARGTRNGATQARSTQNRDTRHRSSRDRGAQARGTQARSARNGSTQAHGAQDRGVQNRDAQYRPSRDRGAQAHAAQASGARHGATQARGEQTHGAQDRAAQARAVQARVPQGGEYQRNAARYQNGAARRDAAQRQAAQLEVNYRKDRQAATRKRRFWGAFAAIAAIVVVAAVVGIGFSFVAPQPTRDDSAKPGWLGASDISESSSNASGSGQSSAQGSGDLSGRAADFAVDPNRTDWNYSTNGRKTVYLTIDDGPSAMTPQVLDILDKYNCKATFFVVGHNDDCYPYIAEAFKRGHTIGLHTMTHDYAQVYASADAYYADLEQIGAVVKEQIGFVPCFIRFPGGSSNMVSADYCKGIMSEISGGVQKMGYQYYDWNLSVGDGSEHTTDEIAAYGMEGDGNENIMLLCHDSATKQATVDALPRIIEHYQALGYTFEAIDRQSWVCHHEVGN